MGLTQAERTELNQPALSRSGRADGGRRARLILLLEAGDTWARSVPGWTAMIRLSRAEASGLGRKRLSGLFSRDAGHGPRKLTPPLEARILDWLLH